MIITETLNHTKPTKKSMFFRDFAVSALMFGLLMAFSKLVKFVVYLFQEFNALNNTFTNELESIERGSSYYIYNYEKMTRRLEKSNELNLTAENLSNQISNYQFLIVVLLILSIIGFVVLYFSIDFLIEYTKKFKPWSIYHITT